MTIDFKSILLAGVLPIIKTISPEAGKLISDAQDAFADKKLTPEEGQKLLFDAIELAKAVWPQGAPALGSLVASVQSVEATIEEFKKLSS